MRGGATVIFFKTSCHDLPNSATFDHLRRLAAVFSSDKQAMVQVAGRPEVIPESLARRHGLTRAWVTRVQLEPGRGRASEMTLHEGLLIAVTDSGVVQALDAESGRTQWLTKVGRRNLPNTPVGAAPCTSRCATARRCTFSAGGTAACSLRSA